MAPPDGLTDAQLDNIQGDIWSKGFPKDYETYYFFSIVPEKRRDFAKRLGELVDSHLISTLRSVKKNRDQIAAAQEVFAQAKKAGKVNEGEKPAREDITNALIAFTCRGLETLQGGLPDSGEDPLNLWTVKDIDKLFGEGMSNDKVGKNRRLLNDPPLDKWDELFKTPSKLHGLFKVAGSSKELVDVHLGRIQKTLSGVIKDIPGKSSPTLTESRMDGWVRANFRGKEHFGYEDGISQPRMKGIDVLEKIPEDPKVKNMNTEPHLIVVSKHTRPDKNERPEWMYDGSFLVVRKLQQNVKAFDDLTARYKEVNCASAAQLGAKLMGRYRNGDPIALPKFQGELKEDPTEVNKDNDWGFREKDEACPIASHIRKTNLRVHIDRNSGIKDCAFTRIIRNGIPYGTDYQDDEGGTARGLLFACYQSHIEDGFFKMQADWSNNTAFGGDMPGHDPIIGQGKLTPTGTNENLETTVTDKTHKAKPQALNFPQLVTMKGGEYFFAPSIAALKGTLAEV